MSIAQYIHNRDDPGIGYVLVLVKFGKGYK